MKSLKSTTSHKFSQVPKAEIQRSSFDRSHGLKSTFDSGYLVPIFCDEALPGDTFNLNMTGFSRMATPIYPVMDNMRMSTFFFAVPMRLVWENWQKFNGEQDNPGDSTDFLIPTITAPPTTGYANESIQDYLGLPTNVPDYEHSVLPLRAINRIYNEWFRDENIQDSLIVNMGDAGDLQSDFTMLRRGKRHDYFTSALPWPQKGDSVSIPLGTSAPVGISGVNLDKVTFLNDGVETNQSVGGDNIVQIGIPATGSPLFADLTTATAATINQLRQSFQVQKMLERDARGGTRYTEIIKAHFGVTSPDARLQRSEYLGGGQGPLVTQPVASTVPTDLGGTTGPQGELAGYTTAELHNHGFTKSFTEHSIILGFICVTADLTYQQGLQRMWSRQTRYDFYWPALAHIGEQSILQKEIYTSGVPLEDDVVFGYQERFAEYRYKPSQITGKFRSNDAQSLDAWHLAQDFESAPTLSPAFIEENPPFERVIAVSTGEPQFIFDSYFQMRCARPMPLYGVPGLIDHF